MAQESRTDRENGTTTIHPRTVSVVMTVKNDPVGCAATLGSLVAQSRLPDEVIVVDGGSTDGTVQMIRQYSPDLPGLRLVQGKGVNIARGRNLGARAARCEIVASIDAGCRADVDWLANLMCPFEKDRDTKFVAGNYRIDPRSLLERVVGLATMRGQLDAADPTRFNPSARSMAFSKSVWLQAGGWPEWIGFSEDTLFDKKIRQMGVEWRFAQDAIVHWRPRSSLSAIGKQFYNYGTGRGHTQIDAHGYLYNIRNIVGMGVFALLSSVAAWSALIALAAFAYFFVWGSHGTAMRVARKVQTFAAYPLCQLVLWIVMVFGSAGFAVGSFQRWQDRERYKLRMETYLTPQARPF